MANVLPRGVRSISAIGPRGVIYYLSTADGFDRRRTHSPHTPSIIIFVSDRSRRRASRGDGTTGRRHTYDPLDKVARKVSAGVCVCVGGGNGGVSE